MKDALDALERLMSVVHMDAGPEVSPKLSDLLRNLDAHCMTIKDRIIGIYQEKESQ